MKSIRESLSWRLRKFILRQEEKIAIDISTAQLHQKTFLQFKNICNGKALVVCGAGPTLQNYVPIKDAVHIACNRAFLYEKVSFDYIFAQDWDGIKMVQDELRNYNPNSCVKLLGNQIGDMRGKQIPESYALSCGALRFNTDSYLGIDGFHSKFIIDIESRAIGNMPNVGISVMQFALYMNPSKLYIVGCDMKGTHASDGNMSEAELKAEKIQYDKYWEDERSNLINKWLEFKEFANTYYPDTEIISVNPVGLRGIFSDWDQA